MTFDVAKLTPPDGNVGDRFGYSVSVSRDGSAVAVGAYGDDENGDDSGAAYVFTKPGGGWTATSTAAKLTSPAQLSPFGAALHRFGSSVSVSGDGDTIAAGAPFEGPGVSYVFSKPASGWVDSGDAANLTAFDRDSGGLFGSSVAASADGATVAVGAYADDENGDDSGAAYVFTKPDGGWTATSTAAKLTALDGAAGDLFGTSVSVSRDGTTVVVGSPLDEDNGNNSGSVYIFTRPSGGWTATSSTVVKFTAPDGSLDDFFGISVSVSGDGSTVVVGAYGADGRMENSGAAYVFTRTAAGWSDTSDAAKLTARDGAAGDRFAQSVSVNEDGSVIAVGAWLDDDKGEDSGSAYVFTRPAGGWADIPDVAKLTAPDGMEFDFFGGGVSVSGDGGTVAVGVLGDDDNGDRSGSAYVFTRPANGWADASDAAKLTATNGAADDRLGRVSVNKDGSLVVVGASGDDDRGYGSGSAYVFTRPDGGWRDTSTTATLRPYTAQSRAGDRFRVSVSVGGDTIAVGAYLASVYSGAAYVFGLTAAPDRVTGLGARADGRTQIDLSWTAPADNGSDITGYELQRKTGGGDFAEIAKPSASDTAYEDTGLSAGTNYTYRLRAVNDVGKAEWSNEASARTAAASSGGGGWGPDHCAVRRRRRRSRSPGNRGRGQSGAADPSCVEQGAGGPAVQAVRERPVAVHRAIVRHVGQPPGQEADKRVGGRIGPGGRRAYGKGPHNRQQRRQLAPDRACYADSARPEYDQGCSVARKGHGDRVAGRKRAAGGPGWRGPVRRGDRADEAGRGVAGCAARRERAGCARRGGGHVRGRQRRAHAYDLRRRCGAVACAAGGRGGGVRERPGARVLGERRRVDAAGASLRDGRFGPSMGRDGADPLQ